MKCVPVHHGIPAVLHRDEPWLHRHSENGALYGKKSSPDKSKECRDFEKFPCTKQVNNGINSQ